MKSKYIWVMLSISAVMALVLSGCSPDLSLTSTSTQSNQVNQSASPANSVSNQVGQIEIKVTDAPPKEEVTSVMVTVTSVQIHEAGNSADSDNSETTSTTNSSDSDSGWMTLEINGPSTFDLLKIKGLQQKLAVGDLPEGKYTQIRMEVSKVQIAISGGELQDATIPSGKLKFVQPFDIVEGESTVILFDFDAAQSVNITGNNKIMFKPVIKLTTETPKLITKNSAHLEIITSVLENGEAGVSYSDTLKATGGTTLYNWIISSGDLPDGLRLGRTSGVISGEPNSEGNFNFTAQVEDNSTIQQKATKEFTIVIAAEGDLLITTVDIPDGVKGVDYSAQIEAVGGTDNLTWSVSSGDLTAGLALNDQTGVISGTPVKTGESDFTIKVIDDDNPPNSDSQKFTLTVLKE